MHLQAEQVVPRQQGVPGRLEGLERKAAKVPLDQSHEHERVAGMSQAFLDLVRADDHVADVARVVREDDAEDDDGSGI